MGKLLGRLLRSARDERNKLQKDMVHATGIAASRLSEFENGIKSPPKPNQLAKLADAYDIPYPRLVRTWLLDELHTDEAKDRLIAEVFPVQTRDTLNPVRTGLDAIGSNRRLHRVARRVVEEIEQSKRVLDETTLNLLSVLNRLPEVQIEEGKASKCVKMSSAKWTQLEPNKMSSTEKCTVFAVKRPTPLVVELHRLAPKMVGLHRQAHLQSRPAYYELWSLLSGQALLLVEEEAGWVEYVVDSGDCGSYWSGHRHAWVNLDDHLPLVVYHIFFPYRSGGLRVDGPGEAMEFPRDNVPQSVADDVQQALRQALVRIKRRE